MNRAAQARYLAPSDLYWSPKFQRLRRLSHSPGQGSIGRLIAEPDSCCRGDNALGALPKDIFSAFGKPGKFIARQGINLSSHAVRRSVSVTRLSLERKAAAFTHDFGDADLRRSAPRSAKIWQRATDYVPRNLLAASPSHWLTIGTVSHFVDFCFARFCSFRNLPSRIFHREGRAIH